MKRAVLAAALFLVPAPVAFAQTAQAVPPGEEAVDPYEMSNANAGGKPFEGTQMLEAFHGRDGISRIVEDLVAAVQTDTRTEEVFKASDIVRLKRTLREQFCYLLNGGCDYTGRDMKSVHADHGVMVAEFNALVELLQDAMDREGVSSFAQNRFLAKLAPMKRDTVRR